MIVFSLSALLIVGCMSIAFSLLGILDMHRHSRKSIGLAGLRR